MQIQVHFDCSALDAKIVRPKALLECLPDSVRAPLLERLSNLVGFGIEIGSAQVLSTTGADGSRSIVYRFRPRCLLLDKLTAAAVWAADGGSQRTCLT